MNNNRVRVSHPTGLDVAGEPAHHGLQHILLVTHVEFLHGQQLTQALGQQLTELLSVHNVPEVGLQILGSHVVHVVQAIVQGEKPDTDAVLRCDAALQELTAQ